MFLAKEYSFEDDKMDPAEVDRSEVRLFRDVQLGHYKELAAGKIAEKDYFKVSMRWAHEERVAEAKHTLSMIPTGSDREIRAYLAEQYAELMESDTPDPNAITREEIAEFRNEDLPELKALANGERPYHENPEDLKTAKEALDEFEETEAGGWAKALYFLKGFGLGGFGITVMAIGLAYRISTHAE